MRQIRVQNNVSQCVKVCIQEVPAYGLLDRRADISIIGGDMFRKVCLCGKIKDFKVPDKIPRTYDQ